MKKTEIELLRKILKDKTTRVDNIKEFQNLVWNDKENNSLLGELAYDLDFYVADEKTRQKDSSYYGDERLEKEILTVIKLIEKIE